MRKNESSLPGLWPLSCDVSTCPVRFSDPPCPPSHPPCRRLPESLLCPKPFFHPTFPRKVFPPHLPLKATWCFGVSNTARPSLFHLALLSPSLVPIFPTSSPQRESKLSAGPTGARGHLPLHIPSNRFAPPLCRFWHFWHQSIAQLRTLLHLFLPHFAFVHCNPSHHSWDGV